MQGPLTSEEIYARVSIFKQFPMKYGTAGFRAEASTLERVMYWCGVVAALRSQYTRLTTGVVITASHNPERDNGVKLVDPDGGMLEQTWEEIASRFVALNSVEEIEAELAKIRATFLVNLSDSTTDASQVAADAGVTRGEVLVACDTRVSSAALKSIVIEGVKAVGSACYDMGLLTTPQLHWAVLQRNRGGDYDEMSYYKHMASALATLLLTTPPPQLPPLIFDGANGIGAPKFQILLEEIRRLGVEWNCVVMNHPGDGGLNDGVGSEHVQKTKTPPRNATVPQPGNVNAFASVDGDADRLVLFYFAPNGTLQLLDGDKIASLLGGYIKRLVGESSLALNVRIVQTAYANGASTKYMNETMGVEVAIAKTGVKHLHHKALSADIGVYFEANGHGTVIFSQKARDQIRERAATGAVRSAVVLNALMELINPAVGDALSDLLAVQAVLHLSGLSLDAWQSFYFDLPSVMTKEIVRDRYAFEPNDDETRLVRPSTVQREIDLIVASVGGGGGRAFVRPSGTEDCVRVYAEGPTEEIAREIAARIGVAVQKYDRGELAE